MFKLARFLTRSNLVSIGKFSAKPVPIAAKRFYSSEIETYEEMDVRMLQFFNREDIDGWWIRKGLQELQDIDAVPEPEIIIAALHAIRRVNDFALAVRFLEAIQVKCGPLKHKIWPYLLGEIQPTLTKLGIPTPEEIGYDKPELYLEKEYDRW